MAIKNTPMMMVTDVTMETVLSTNKDATIIRVNQIVC